MLSAVSDGIVSDAAVGAGGPPSLAEVERIVSLADPVLRNLRITQAYHELSLALAARTGGAPARHANWCTFATWASRQAGQTIRGEDLTDALERALELSPDSLAALRDLVRELEALGAPAHDLAALVRERWVRRAVERASGAVARGNRKVFEEIGREFARYLAEVLGDGGGSIEAFLGGLRDGDPPHGQGLLRRAFSRYHRALAEPDFARRAELVHCANLEIGLHEQTRLQPEIVESLDAAVPDSDDLARELVSQLLPRTGSWLLGARRWLGNLWGGPTPLERATRRLVDAARGEVRRALTEHMMVLALPRGEVVRLGQDLSGAFAPSLATIRDPDLAALVARVDPTADRLRGSGASDWGSLAERIHFIADLFRCRHESEALFDPPFTLAQAQAIRAGRRPAGAL